MATTIDPKVSGPVFDPASSDPWRDHAVAVPLVLLPVRVETRWFSTGDPAQLELRVRIYPDAVHVANRAEVSAAEREQTIAYWQVRLADGEAAATSRWGGLCADVGAARARWLRDRLAPTVGPDGQPQFPPASATPTVAVARGLPSRFAVALCAGAAVVGSRWGAPVPDELAVLDDRDFAAAEAVGLALRLTVARGTAIGLTHLVVFGLRGGAPNADQAVLEGLLGDHAIDRGLALLADGATTAAGDPGRPTIDAGGAAVALDDASDGARLARALGVTRDALALAAGATRDTDAVARAMATATWPATWGYFLESIVGSPIAADARAAGRSLFIDDVRAAGPLPILAVGRQPYGVLPVSALSRWRGDDGAVAPLASALQALLPRWVGAGELAPRLPATGDALPALQAILARQERSTRYRVRTAMAYDVATATWFGEDVDDARRAALHALLVTPLVAQLAALGVAVPDPAALTPLVYAEAAREVMAPLVGGVGPDAPAYLAALAAAPDPWKIRDGELAGASPRTILYALVRHATLLVLGRAADRLLVLPTDEWREPDVVPSATASVWDRMAQPIAAHGGQSARELLQKGEVIADSPELRAHRDALRVLAASSVAELERATSGALDVASHRLDAWVTALAARRLRTLRAQVPTGAHLGAYAWLSAPPVPATPVADGAIEDRGSRGFVLAPSLDHARTAAVLRSGFDARPTGDLAVDLSSRRVQRSRALFDGLRAGHGLAELLGYEIERLVDDAAVVRVLRQEFPLAYDGEPDPNRARLDGLAAYQRWRATPPSGDLANAAQALFELVDGAADLLLAESIHQQVRGNPDRAGATLASVAAGTVAPPPCAVIDTPPTASLRRYQVVWGFDDGDGWPGDTSRVRAVANPRVNAALAALIAAPTELRATIEYGPEGALVSTTRSVVELELCPLDLCALAGDGFAGSALEAAFAASVPEAVAPRVRPSSALVTALVTARGLREALGRAVPWGETPGPEATWAATATSLLGELTAAADAVGARRLAAWLGAASTDASALRALAAARLPAITGAAAEQVQLLSGFPPPRGPLSGLAPATELAAPIERVGWLADVARVRAPLAGVELVATMTSLSSEAAADFEGGTVVVIGASAGAATLALRVDAWVEARPSTSHDGAVALHHDAPRARAPQAILVAVPPVAGAAWTPAALFDVVAETFDLVAARGARPSQVWGPTWPALYLAERLDRTTVSTAMSELAVNLEVGD